MARRVRQVGACSFETQIPRSARNDIILARLEATRPNTTRPSRRPPARSSMLRWLVNLVDRHRAEVLGLLIVATVASGFAAQRIRYDFRPRALFAGDDNLLEVADQVRETFGSDNAVALIIAEAVGDRDALDQELLTWQARVAREVKQLEGTADVDAVVLLRPPRPGLIRGWRTGVPIVRQLPVTDEAEERLRNVLTETPLVTGTLLSADRRLSVIAVTVKPGATDFEPVRRLVQDLQHVLQSQPPPTGYQVLLSGLPPIRVEIVEEMRQDQRTLIPLVAVLFVVVLMCVYRHFATALVPLISVGVGLVWTLGWMGLQGQDFNLISNALPLLLLVIGTSNTVHILHRYTQRAARERRRLSRRRTRYDGPHGAGLLPGLDHHIDWVLEHRRGRIGRTPSLRSASGGGHVVVVREYDVDHGNLFADVAPRRDEPRRRPRQPLRPSFRRGMLRFHSLSVVGLGPERRPGGGVALLRSIGTHQFLHDREL